MGDSNKIIISASRRSDIPAFYMPWFMERIAAGFFEVENPFNGRVSIVPAALSKVHSIVFWSKNFGPFLESGYGEKLSKQGYRLFFNATVNSESAVLEPNLPPLNLRLDPLARLCRRFGPETVNWRFDPLCFFRTAAGLPADNLSDFSRIAARAREYGIRRCITSFMDHYPKIRRRLSGYPGVTFFDPPLEKKVEIIGRMETELAAADIRLFVCCEKEILDGLPPDSKVTGSACIPGELLRDLFDGRLPLKRDGGQRVKAGCGCQVSTDIGSYRRQPCYHNCLFCYANPA